MKNTFDVHDVRLNFNPEAPQERFKAAGLRGALVAASDLMPSQVPWPDSSKPTPAPLKSPPAETDDLSKFEGYDAVVVTYTAAEAATLAALFTPGYETKDWYEYRHDINAYIPLVTGEKAPFNDKSPNMSRYYHSLGLYFPCTIGKARVLLMKSGLHLDYDGPATPFHKLVTEIVETVKPKVFITTGTGGGIGKQVALGDIIIAPQTKFDCTTQFANKPWKSAAYPTSPVPQSVLNAITPALLTVNASRIQGAHSVPHIWHSAADAVVTTDFFEFDDSTDHYHLEGSGRVCEMGDSMVGNVMQQYKDVQWFAIRNASDPQIPNPNNDIEAASKESSQIYSRWGALTTAGSVIATWAIISTMFSK